MDEYPRTPRLALLIDADNTSFRYLPIILNEVPRHGIATYRRIYGDFTDPQAVGWRSVLLDNAIMPIQQFSNVKSHAPGEVAGKNATDSTLIIDAMDILYSGNVDGFVIVTSDSDFTRLAQRLREGGKVVVGMGRSQTSKSFRRACTTFVNIENLMAAKADESSAEGEAAGSTASAQAEEETIPLSQVEDVIAEIVRDNEDKGEYVLLSLVGAGLRTRLPDFDVRAYGYTQLSRMIGDMPRFELKGSGPTTSVTLADSDGLDNEIRRYIRELLIAEKDHKMLLSKIGSEVHKKYPRFNSADTGYTQFWRFVESIKDVELLEPDHQLAHLAR